MKKIRSLISCKKVALIVVTIFFAVCLLEINVFNTYQEPVEYTLESVNVDMNLYMPVTDTIIRFEPEQKYMKNIRFILAQIPSDGSGTVEIKLFHDDKLLYRGLRACSKIKVGEWTDFETNLTLNTSETYEIHITVNDTELFNEAMICCYSEIENQTKPLISIGYAPLLDVQDKALTTLFVFLVYIGVVCLIIKANKLKKQAYDAITKNFPVRFRSPRFASIVSLSITYLVLELSKLAIDISLKIIISVMVFGATYWVENNWDKVSKRLKDKKCAAIMILLAAWTAFSLIGSRCFIYPINMNITIGAVLLYIITVLLMFPLVSVIMIKSEEFCEKHVREREEKVPWDFVIVTIVAVLISALYYLRAFNPAISSPDTKYCMYYGLNSIRGINDWHPAFYILWLKAILRIIPTAQAVVVVQYIFYIYVLLRGFLFLYEKGLPKQFLYGAMLLTVFNCANTLHLMTIWKDIPYTLSITWLTILIAILLFGERKRKVYIYIELIVALIWTCFFRQPGIVPFIIVGIALILMFRESWKIWFSVIAAVCIALVIKFPVYNYYEIQTDHGGGIYIGLGQDIMGVYYNGGEISESAMEIVNVLSESDIAGYAYSPYRATASYELNVTKVEFIKAYIDTFIKNPVMMTRSVLCRMDTVWDVFMGEDGILGCVGFTGTMDGEEINGEKWENLWGERENNFITQRVQDLVTYSVENPILNVLEWRTGIWFLAFLLAMGICSWKQKFNRTFLLFTPCVSHILSLALSTGWSDFRYFWPINLMTLFVFLTVVTLKSEKNIE